MITSKEITLKDFMGKKTTYLLQDKPIEAIVIDIVSGDEIAMVQYADKECEVFDSANNRRCNIYDSTFVLAQQDDFDRWMASKERKN